MITPQDLQRELSTWYGNKWHLAIYQHYCGVQITPSVNIISPIRDDDTAPSLCVFLTDEGEFLAYDYAYAKTYNVFTFVHAYYDNQNKTQTPFEMGVICSLIDADMGLGISDDVFDIPDFNAAFTIPSRGFKKQDPPEIAVYPNTWGGADTNYWGEYFITEEWLKFFDAGVSYKTMFSWDKTLTWKEWHRYKQRDPCYYYHFIDDNGRSKFKLLRPFSDRKWYTNISKSDLCSIQGFRQADYTQDKVFLTSSLKDIAILRMLGWTSYACHGEGYVPTPEFIAHLKANHKEVYLFMDNDRAGRIATDKLLAIDPIFKSGLFVPNGLLFQNNKEVSDPSDFIKYNGEGGFNLLSSIINTNIL